MKKMLWVFIATIVFVFVCQDFAVAERKKDKIQKRETVISRQKKAKMEEQRNSNTLTNKPWSTSGSSATAKKHDQCASACRQPRQGEYYLGGMLYSGKYDLSTCTGKRNGIPECH